MYKVGDYLMYKTDGVCKVNQITMMAVSPKETTKKLYYVLVPVRDEGMTIYTAVDNTAVARRPVMTKQEAENMVKSLPGISELELTNEKSREEIYKKSLKSCNCTEWFRLTKTIYFRKAARMKEGKKSTAMDEMYLKAAEALMVEELSVALGKTASEVKEMIAACC